MRRAALEALANEMRFSIFAMDRFRWQNVPQEEANLCELQSGYADPGSFNVGQPIPVAAARTIGSVWHRSGYSHWRPEALFYNPATAVSAWRDGTKSVGRMRVLRHQG
jgi:hypothetical protein